MASNQNWNESKLEFYLLHDSWSAYSAWRILSGFDFQRDLRPLDGGFDYFCDKFEHDKIEMEASLDKLKKLWINSKKDDEIHSPTYFIEWALSKRFRPEWLNWAIEKNLYIPTQEIVSEQISTGYVTPWLLIQRAAIKKFFDPRHDRDFKSKEVVDWIILQATHEGILNPKNISEAIFTIIKPEDHDPRIDRKKVTDAK